MWEPECPAPSDSSCLKGWGGGEPFCFCKERGCASVLERLQKATWHASLRAC